MKKTKNMNISFRPIGMIYSPFKDVKGMPIQPKGAKGVRGTVEVNPEFADGLTDLEGFSHIILLYHFHQAKGYKLMVTPFLDSKQHGVFSTRAPRRPNPFGLSVVRLVNIMNNRLQIENVDILDGTPLIDIKPYVSEFDVHPADHFGWLDKAKRSVQYKKSDNRFE